MKKSLILWAQFLLLATSLVTTSCVSQKKLVYFKVQSSYMPMRNK